MPDVMMAGRAAPELHMPQALCQRESLVATVDDDNLPVDRLPAMTPISR